MFGSMRTTVIGGMLAALLITASQPAHALQISQEEFADTFKDGELELVLMGAALKRFQVLKAVAVGFYLEEGVEEDEILTPIPKRVEIAYLQNISRTELMAETTEGLRDNLSADAFDGIQEDLKTFAGWMRDMEPGDRYAMTYRPGQGTEVRLNGVLQGTIASDDFALGFFSIYVGAKPADPRAKGKLLGRLEFNK